MKKILFCLSISFCLNVIAHQDWNGKNFSELAHLPSPIPDRVVLTWNDDPATTQSVNWRTDISVKKGFAQIAIANANGRTLRPKKFDAKTTYFKSDINEAHYHSVTLKTLKKTLCMLTGLVMELIGLNTITLELQALKKNHLVLFILEMRKMK